jgi:hypothetical protein
VKALSLHAPIVYCTGRSEIIREETILWLQKHSLPIAALYMRPLKSNTIDTECKRELLKQMRDDGYDPIIVFDDRTRVVNMWREEGVPCLQVAAGDY